LSNFVWYLIVCDTLAHSHMGSFYAASE